MALKDLDARYATKGAKDYKLTDGRDCTYSSAPMARSSGG
jgi:hypothetical protein